MIEIHPFKREHYKFVASFKVNPHSCCNHTHYEDFLKYNALQDMRTGKIFTYVALEFDESNNVRAIAGFISARASSFLSQTDDGWDGMPAIEINQLAVDENYQGERVGTALVGKVLELALELALEHVGVEYVILRSDPKSVSFYEKPYFGFKRTSHTYEVPKELWNRSSIPMHVKLAISSN